MTLAEGKRKVLMLIDEYSSGGTITVDADIEAKMADFFDQAQKQVAQIKKIQRMYEIPRMDGVTAYGMPADFIALKAVWRNGEKTNRYTWRAGKLIVPETDTAMVQVEYFAAPQTIGPDTPETYEFEVAPDAAEAMPYFVAAQQLIVDLVVDYSALLQLYQMAISAINTNGEGVNLVNTFYRV